MKYPFSLLLLLCSSVDELGRRAKQRALRMLRIPYTWRSPVPLVNLSHRFCFNLNSSSSVAAKASGCLDRDCEAFLPWLEKKAGTRITSLLSIGKSEYGRSLFASREIKTGDCILEVPYSVDKENSLILLLKDHDKMMQVTPANLPPELESCLADKVGKVAKLAVVILVEQKKSRHSEWTHYIECLPNPSEIHSTMFWSEEELDMIRLSSVYQETMNKKTEIQMEFKAIMQAIEKFPELLGGVTLKDFMHAYFAVESRAWESTGGYSLIPFADFLNHGGSSNSILESYDLTKTSEVIADRNYAPGEEVLISYGKFPNSTLLLDFGFTVPYNIYDQVQIQMKVRHDDGLYEMKSELLQQNFVPTIHPEGYFTIKEVRSVRGKGKGIPQSLRAYARILCSNSAQELKDLAKEAARNDGRLARKPLRSLRTEILAHEMLLSHINQLKSVHTVALKSLGPIDSGSMIETSTLRRKMAYDLFAGEHRVLNSASAWLKSYIDSLLRRGG